MINFVLIFCVFVYRQWGFYCFLKDLFTAHDDVMRYLCQTYRMHDIPLGNDWTTRNADKVGISNIIILLDACTCVRLFAF